jgi:hypothetical protein
MSDRTRIATGLDEDGVVENLKADLRGRLWERYGKRSGAGWKNVADEAGLCVTTISNFAQGITKKPQGDTLIRIGIAVGWMIPNWVDMGTGKPIKLGSYAKHVPESVLATLNGGTTEIKKKKKVSMLLQILYPTF